MDRGNIILLNGTSSSGKTVITKALQETLDGYYLHTGLDHYLERVPEKFNLVSEGDNPSMVDGLLWVTPDGGKHITEIRIGSAGLKLLAGMYRACAALASTGNNLIIDDVIFDSRVLRAAVDTLHTYNVLFVGIKCPFEVAQQREQERGDRFLGLVKAHYDLIHTHGVYDLEVDTSSLSVTECAKQIQDRLYYGIRPDAFMRLHKKLKDL